MFPVTGWMTQKSPCLWWMGESVPLSSLRFGLPGNSKHENFHSRPDMIESIKVRGVELGSRRRHGLLVVPEPAGHVGKRDRCHELPRRAVRHFLARAIRECRVEDARIGA